MSKTVELERSNLSNYAANKNEILMKAATQELQLRTKTDGKIKKKDRQHRKRKYCKVSS